MDSIPWDFWPIGEQVVQKVTISDNLSVKKASAGKNEIEYFIFFK